MKAQENKKKQASYTKQLRKPYSSTKQTRHNNMTPQKPIRRDPSCFPQRPCNQSTVVSLATSFQLSIMLLIKELRNWGRIETHNEPNSFIFSCTLLISKDVPSKQRRFLSFQIIHRTAIKVDFHKSFPLAGLAIICQALQRSRCVREDPTTAKPKNDFCPHRLSDPAIKKEMIHRLLI